MGWGRRRSEKKTEIVEVGMEAEGRGLREGEVDFGKGWLDNVRGEV